MIIVDDYIQPISVKRGLEVGVLQAIFRNAVNFVLRRDLLKQ